MGYRQVNKSNMFGQANSLLFVAVGFIAVLFVGVVFFLKKLQRGSIDDDEIIRDAQNVEAEAHPRNPRLPRRRRVLRHDVLPDEEDSNEEEENNFVETDVKVGAKKLKKLEEKATRKAQREALEQERKEKKIREENLEKQRKKEEARIEAEEAAKAAEEQRKKEEKEKQEFEEYLKIKEAFIVEEEGEQAEDEQDIQSLLLEFIEYIKEKKVVVLEDLAYHFKIKAQDAIDRIKTLQEEDQLTGVIDDRGKFIYITKDEYEAVAKFIKQRGRVSISELAESMNRLINLNPDNKLKHIYMPADVNVNL